jgi:hypothetical protein
LGKQQAIIWELKDKLNYDRPYVPLPPIDPDGVEENDDPDGYPPVRSVMDEDELRRWLAVACWDAEDEAW